MASTKLKKKKVSAPTQLNEKLIQLNVKIAGQNKEIKTDNILSALRELKIDEAKIKSRATFEVFYKGDVHRRVLTIIQMKRVLGNDINRQILAKQLSSAVGITNK